MALVHIITLMRIEKHDHRMPKCLENCEIQLLPLAKKELASLFWCGFIGNQKFNYVFDHCRLKTNFVLTQFYAFHPHLNV